MSWSYLPEPGAESTAVCYSDTLPSAPSRLSPRIENCCCNDSATACSRASPCGTTCARLTVCRGEALSTSCQADSPAPTSAQQVKAPESTASNPASGERWRASFARFDRDTCSWRTAQCSLLGDSGESSVIWPRSGMTVGGLAYPLPTAGRRTSGTESGFLPTPNACLIANSTNVQCSGDGRKKPNKLGWYVGAENGLAGFVRMPTPASSDWKGSSKPGQRRGQLTDPTMGVIPAGGQLNPTFVEWLMGWPIGSTAFSPLAMDRFREFMRQHGGCCHAIHDVCGDFVQKTVDS